MQKGCSSEEIKIMEYVYSLNNIMHTDVPLISTRWKQIKKDWI